MKTSNWPFGTDLSHPNFTGISRNYSSGYAPGSERPSCGWCIALLIGLALFALLLFGPTAAARMIGI